MVFSEDFTLSEVGTHSCISMESVHIIVRHGKYTDSTKRLRRDVILIHFPTILC
jgi:hypothetical protein